MPTITQEPITHEQERTAPEREYDEKVLERVLRGLKWLEETHGPGWEDKIDLATLDLSSGARCVLGQVYREEADPDNNGFAYATDHLMNPSCCCSYGFVSGTGTTYSQLQAAWEDVLTPKVNPGS